MSIKIKPSKRNTNKHTEKGMSLLEHSIDTIGVIESISVTDEGTIISGHARKELFDKKGMIPKEIKLADNEYPVIVTDIKDDTKEYYQAQILANTTAHHNYNLDTTEIEVIAMEYDLEVEELGIEIEEVAMDGVEPENRLEAKEDDFDATPPTEPTTVLGDLYEIGEHRLLCGDSTDSDQVAKLMNGEKADMVFTDPPYGMFLDTNYDQMFANDKNHKKTGERFDKVKGDHNDFVPELINTIFACFNDTKEIFIWGADYFAELIPDRINGSWVVWDKRCDENMDKVSGNTFELCWSKQKHKRLVARILWSGHHGMHKDDTKTRVHPTQKPTELAKWFFNQWGKENDLVADLFLGSGSTMVASHQLKRKCYGMELDPKYCDVIVKRMLKLDNSFKIKCNGVDVTSEWLERIKD